MLGLHNEGLTTMDDNFIRTGEDDNEFKKMLRSEFQFSTIKHQFLIGTAF